ncbi:AraC family transcriptional regulator [Thalassotalea psychrophila]|uniref:AraC family transcriptional regulator n=1 Tax=Thalassotalea psychrophila TaxID=3065647 RepID=A0ABY9TYA7_9GAMM|nr:AraC family transcriptional regulator [Colwelliaceae bacterium SQ149]
MNNVTSAKNVEVSRQTIENLLNRKPIASYKQGEKVSFRLERYVCSEITGTVPPLKSILIGVQFSGARIKTSGIQGNTDHSSSSVVTIFPADQKTRFDMLGEVDFALMIIDPKQNQLTEKLYRMAKSLVSVVMVGDPVLDALIRQLLQISSEQNSDDINYIDALTETVLLHSERVLSKQHTTAFASNSLQLFRIRSTIEYIQLNLGKNLSVHHLADVLSVSESYFRRIFTAVTGQSVHQFILQTRLNRTRELLIHSSLSICQIAESLGFSSQSHLTTQFAKFYQMTPAQLRKKMRL